MVERVRWLPSILVIAVSLAACGGDDNSLLRRPVLGAGGQDAGSHEAGGGGTAGRGGAGSGGRGSGGVAAQPPCQNSLDCTGSAPRAICDQATRLCVECVQTADCEARHDCLNNTCVAYTTCVNSLGCPNGQICDTARGRCFECVSSGDCAADSACVANRCQKKCVSDRTCTPLGLLCDTAAGVCVQCLVDTDCSANQNCNTGTCANRAAGAGGVGNGGQAGAGGFGGAGGVSSGGAGGGASTGGAGGAPTVTKHILLVADASGSMLEPGGTGIAKWTELTNGVNAFTADPASATVAAAFQIFPQLNAPCDGTTYVTPLVAIGPLGPGTQTAQAITTEMTSHTPGVSGAIQSDVEAALRGATAFCANHRISWGEDCDVVFVTDGNPTLCSADTAVLAQIAGNAFTDSGVRTWIVALLGADFGQVDEIARQGGTDCDTTGPGYACNASGASPTVQALLGYVRDHLGN